MRRFSLPLLTVLMAVGFQLGAASTASAHTVLLSNVSASCDGSEFNITYTVTSWDTSGAAQGLNPQIDVFFDNALVDTQAFTPGHTSFTATKPAPAGATAGTTVTVKAVATGNWGNGTAGGQLATDLATLPSSPCGVIPGTGRFTGGGKMVDVGVAKVTDGLTIHCDLKLSNNLEINWGVGEKFHMTEHLTASCSDDVNIDQKPPVAPLDTLVGTGKGKYNNVAGYNISFTLVDAGEPGRNDKFGFRITNATTGAVVLDVPVSFLVGGNLQAHYDQPHKKP